MARDLISKKTRYEFREFLVGWTLREIEMEFDGGDVFCAEVPPEKLPNGQRRSLVERYYASVNWSDPFDVQKVLKVYENILATIEDHSPERVAQLSKWIERDGYQYKDGRIAPGVGVPHADALAQVARKLDASELARQIQRLNECVQEDPSLALGTAKELVESTCRTILLERGEPVEGAPDVPQLVKQTVKVLRLLPDDVPKSAKGSNTIKRLLSNLATVAQGLSELRNWYGTGHGREGRAKAIRARHAKLGVGAGTTLALFLFETHQDQPEGTQQRSTVGIKSDSSKRSPPVQISFEDTAKPGDTSQ